MELGLSGVGSPCAVDHGRSRSRDHQGGARSTVAIAFSGSMTSSCAMPPGRERSGLHPARRFFDRLVGTGLEAGCGQGTMTSPLERRFRPLKHVKAICTRYNSRAGSRFASAVSRHVPARPRRSPCGNRRRPTPQKATSVKNIRSLGLSTRSPDEALAVTVSGRGWSTTSSEANLLRSIRWHLAC
jgi:hypothetical protein